MCNLPAPVPVATLDARWRRLRSQLAAKQAALMNMSPLHPCYAQYERDCGWLTLELQAINDTLR